MRIGQGFDAHALVPGRRLVIGGVTIPYQKGLAGHSDADVLLHAICDALLGAAALGDIGQHFPDSDRKFKGASSLTFLTTVRNLLTRKKFQIVNVDSTIVLQQPKISPFVPQLQKNIAKTLGNRIVQVSVKATTNEGLGALGAGAGCAAYAVASIRAVK